MVAADGKLWILGGWSADVGLVSAVQVLEPTKQSWVTVTHLPTPRREPAAALLGRRIVVVGGFNGRNDGDLHGYSDIVESYDLDTGQWSKLACLLVPRRGLTMVSVDGYLYAIGGYRPGDGFLDTVEQYDPLTNTWEFVVWRPVPRTWAASVTVGGDILVIGGYNLNGHLDLVERVDPRTGLVCHPSPLQVPRSWLAAVEWTGGVLALGGESHQGFGPWVELIDPDCPNP